MFNIVLGILTPRVQDKITIFKIQRGMRACVYFFLYTRKQIVDWKSCDYNVIVNIQIDCLEKLLGI